jgi:tripartite-type tricarboxylate transporter receptor subunit TctC
MGHWLTERLGQPFVIENRPGAASNIATEMAVRAPADGYTLLMVNSSHAINATLYTKLNFNFARDIVAVASFYRVPNVMVINSSVPVNTVTEFISYANANPGKVYMGSSGIGTTPHVCGELFKMMTGVNLVHVPYRGAAPAVTDLLAGQVQVMFDTMSTSIEYIRSGRLRALAVGFASPLGACDPPHIPKPKHQRGLDPPRQTPRGRADERSGPCAALRPRTRVRSGSLKPQRLPATPSGFSGVLAD